MSIAPTNIAPPVISPIEHTEAKHADLGEAFQNVLTAASNAEKTSTHDAERFAKGDPTMGIHEVMIASEKANIEVRYATTLKNKAIEAYRELMNTQV